MKKFIFIPLHVIVIILTNCEKDNEVNQKSLQNRTWFESYEESTSEEINIYRSGAYDDFPPSWYRQMFYFDDNDECEYSVLAADDGHYVARGTWEYNDKGGIIKIYNSDSEKIYEFKIVELTDQVLKLKAID